MPTKTATWSEGELMLDARPDRLDIRDLPYMPPVENLPPVYPAADELAGLLPNYVKAGFVRDQKSNGACTGFGLAAVINILHWIEAGKHGKKMTKADEVSPRMLYHLARFYDEWPGEDYDGSSCRGALKGWHRHGVCLEDKWPYMDGEFTRPKEGWDADAITRPLGIYYRIQRDSVVNMQAAIRQTGAIYVSANIHDGWNITSSEDGPPSHTNLPVIGQWHTIWGGHAFAIIGYNEDGFIVQNSWGKKWGRNGFAILSYEDWVTHGSDAWVVALGVPVRRMASATIGDLSQASPQYYVAGSRQWKVGGEEIDWLGNLLDPLRNREGAWDKQKAYWHSLVTGNDGEIIHRLPHTQDAQDNLKFVAFEQPQEWFNEWSKKTGKDKRWNLVVYAHGGLNSEKASIQRIRVLGPNFEANDIYPLFVTWRSGWLEVVGQMVLDQIKNLFGDTGAPTGSGRENFDRAFEVFARGTARGLWSEMKENIERSSDSGHGLDGLASQLKSLHEASGGKLKIHLAGHSAGSFVCGQLLTELSQREINVETCTLFAPACDVSFAYDHFGEAINEKRLNRTKLKIRVLSNILELDDTVGPYGKSLLYLVSRALERWHKTPLLGLATVFDRNFATEEFWHKETLGTLERWQKFFWEDTTPPTGFAVKGTEMQTDTLTVVSSKWMSTNAEAKIKSAHGSFDNSIEYIGELVETIHGGKLLNPISALD